MPMFFRMNAARLGAMLAIAFAATAMPAAAAGETVMLRYASPAAVLATQVHLPLGTQNYYVGNYTLQMQSPAASFQAYCVDPFHFASTSYLPYQKSPLASFLSGSVQKLADVTSLFSHAYAGSVGNAPKAAGFQLALWEVFNDDKNLASGSVHKTTNTNAAAVADAGVLLASLATATWTTPAANYELTMFSNGQAQSFLAAASYLGSNSIAMPLPEPETAVLMLVGLGLLALASWRGRGNQNPAALNFLPWINGDIGRPIFLSAPTGQCNACVTKSA